MADCPVLVVDTNFSLTALVVAGESADRFGAAVQLDAVREALPRPTTILHGSELMTIDQDVAFGWDPPWWNEHEMHEELWTVTRTAARNWLRNPPPGESGT